MASNHIYVLDTCVLLHDPQALFAFAENDLYIPLAVVNDLDRKKKELGSIGWAARETLRSFARLSESQATTEEGVEVNPSGGRLRFLPQTAIDADIIPAYLRSGDSDDDLILACAKLTKQFPDQKVSLVSMDTGLRLRALFHQITAENYRNGEIANDEHKKFTGVRHVTVESHVDSKILWGAKESIPIGNLTVEVIEQLENLWPNEFVFFHYGEQILHAWHLGKELVTMKSRPIETKVQDGRNKKAKSSFCGIEPRNIEQECAFAALSNPTIPLVTISGPAGTGKTLAPIAVGLQGIKDGIWDKIVVMKPIVPVGGRDIGYLPGDKFEKLIAWLGPLRDNIEQCKYETDTKWDPSTGTDGKLRDLVEEGKLEVEALTYLQGRSIPRAFIIMDEAQNTTPKEARMVIERAAEGSKVVLIGDPSQIEHTFLDKRSCGLAHAMNGGKFSPLCAAVTLTKVVRSPLAAIASEIFSFGSR